MDKECCLCGKEFKTMTDRNYCAKCLEAITVDIDKDNPTSKIRKEGEDIIITTPVDIRQETGDYRLQDIADMVKNDMDTKINSMTQNSEHVHNPVSKIIGIKHDESKLEWSLLPMREVEDVIKVLMHGSKKYSRDNWQFVKPKERYIDAAFRHLSARAQGEMIDKESGMSHLAHAACCLLFLSWHDKEELKDA